MKGRMEGADAGIRQNLIALLQLSSEPSHKEFMQLIDFFAQNINRGLHSANRCSFPKLNNVLQPSITIVTTDVNELFMVVIPILQLLLIVFVVLLLPLLLLQLLLLLLLLLLSKVYLYVMRENVRVLRSEFILRIKYAHIDNDQSQQVSKVLFSGCISH